MLSGKVKLLFTIEKFTTARGRECSSVGLSIGPARRRRRFDSPVWQGIFLLESTFSADSLTVSVHPVRNFMHLHLCTR